MNKREVFMNNSDWSSFKARLIDKFGSINIFARDANRVFNLLPITNQRRRYMKI